MASDGGRPPGTDIGRNIFLSDAPQAMIAAVAAVVQKNLKPKDAFDLFKTLKAKGEGDQPRVRSVS